MSIKFNYSTDPSANGKINYGIVGVKLAGLPKNQKIVAFLVFVVLAAIQVTAGAYAVQEIVNSYIVYADLDVPAWNIYQAGLAAVILLGMKKARGVQLMAIATLFLLLAMI